MSRRIVLLCTGLGRGGAETQLVRLAFGLKARGWAPTIGSIIPMNAFGDELAAAGVPSFCLDIPKGRMDPRGLARLVRVVRAVRPDVLCTFLEAANTLGGVAGRLCRVPAIVASIRSTPRETAAVHAQIKYGRPLRDAIVYNSHLVAEDSARLGLVRRDELRVILNGMEFAPFDAAERSRADARAELTAGDEEPAPFVWLAVGNLRVEKNHPALVRAVAELHRRHRQVRLVCAGKPYDKEAGLRALAPELCAQGVIRFLGPRTDVPRLLAGADAFVLASRAEGTPNALLEAMASRLPCVATAISGVPELMPGESTGLLAADTSDGAILAAMERMMGLAEAERRAMGARARELVEARYQFARMVDEFEGLFLSLLETRRAA